MNGSKNQMELEHILEEIEKRPELATIFNRLEDDTDLRALFMLHPHELFMSSDGLIIPYLLSVSNTDVDKSLVLSLTSDIDFAMFQKAYRTFLFQIKNLPRVFLDLFAYGAIILARTNEEINDLITGDFSFAKMRSVLGRFNIDEVWNEVGNKINVDDDPSLLQVKKEYEAEAKNWEKRVKSNPMKFIESLLDMQIPNIRISIHEDAGSHVGSILKKLEMNMEEYNRVLSHLYGLKLIKRQDSIFRCENCIDDPQLLKSSSMIGPNRMTIKCPRCGQQMSYSAILWIDELLKDCLLNKDGLLSVAVAHILKKREINFKSSVQDEKFEYDFICETKKGKVLAECKVHRFPESERSIKGSIEQDLRQASKHMQALNLPSTVVIYNYDLEKYKDLVETGTKKYGIDLIDISEAPDYFTSFIKL